jgi:hypothetical protein
MQNLVAIRGRVWWWLLNLCLAAGQLAIFYAKTACTRLFQMACATPEGSNCSACLGYRVDSLCRSKGVQKSWQS